MSKRGLITIKELSPGVFQLESINRKHQEYFLLNIVVANS